MIGELTMLGEEKRNAIGRNICAARQRRDMTQGRLAELAGVAVEDIAHAEDGIGDVSLELLLEICAATGTAPEAILAGAYVEDNAREGSSLGGETFSFEDIQPEDRALMEHILYFMAHKKPTR